MGNQYQHSLVCSVETEIDFATLIRQSKRRVGRAKPTFPHFPWRDLDLLM